MHTTSRQTQEIISFEEVNTNATIKLSTCVPSQKKIAAFILSIIENPRENLKYLRKALPSGETSFSRNKFQKIIRQKVYDFVMTLRLFVYRWHDKIRFASTDVTLSMNSHFVGNEISEVTDVNPNCTRITARLTRLQRFKIVFIQKAKPLIPPPVISSVELLAQDARKTQMAQWLKPRSDNLYRLAVLLLSSTKVRVFRHEKIFNINLKDCITSMLKSDRR